MGGKAEGAADDVRCLRGIERGRGGEREHVGKHKHRAIATRWQQY